MLHPGPCELMNVMYNVYAWELEGEVLAVKFVCKQITLRDDIIDNGLMDFEEHFSY